MPPYVGAATSAATRTSAGQPQGQPDGDRGKRVGGGGVLLVLGIAAGVYALSPGALHFYRHGHLPKVRRSRR